MDAYHGNSNYAGQRHDHVRKNLPFSKRLHHFTWSWFECTMSTGALATLLGQQPYLSTVFRTLGCILFILNLVLFIAFCGCITYRFAHDRKAMSRSLHHPNESFYFGTFWVSIALLLYGMNEYTVPSAGPWLTETLAIAFWVYAGCVFLVAVFQYHVIFDEAELSVSNAMPSWILPMYPFLILGPLAAGLVKNQPQSRAMPIMLGGLCFQGLGWCFAYIIYTMYVTRLMGSGIPEPSKKPAMYVAVGPAAYTSNTLVTLGMEASKALPPEFLGSATTGEIWKAIGVPAGIFLSLVAIWFCAISTVSVVSSFRQMHFSPTWWSFIFPNAGLAIALLQIADALNSDRINIVGTVLTIVLVVAWLAIMVMHGLAVKRGNILWPGKDEDAEEGEQIDDEERNGRICLP